MKREWYYVLEIRRNSSKNIIAHLFCLEFKTGQRFGCTLSFNNNFKHE